jgi:hypothetical protein
MLVGLHGSTGVLVDAVQAVCAGVDPVGLLKEGAPQGPVFGGQRPLDNKVECPSQQAIRFINVSRNEAEPLVGSIRITCQEVAHPADGGRTTFELRGTGHLHLYQEPLGLQGAEDEGYFILSECTGNMFAVGIRGRSGGYLNAIGLICAPRPTSAPVTTTQAPFANLVGQLASFQTSNYLDRFIRHRHLLAYTEPLTDDLAKQDATFKIVPGLAGKCVSFESDNMRNHFLRHQALRVKIAPREESDLYRQDATFCMMPGLANTAGVSFESVNFPGSFVRHRNNELWLDPFDGSDLNRQDATFNITHPGGAVIVR